MGSTCVCAVSNAFHTEAVLSNFDKFYSLASVHGKKRDTKIADKLFEVWEKVKCFELCS